MGKPGLRSLEARVKVWPFFLKPLETNTKVSPECLGELVLTKTPMPPRWRKRRLVQVSTALFAHQAKDLD